MNRHLRLALFVSLALNLSLAAGLAWLVLRPAPSRPFIMQNEGRPLLRHDALRHALPRERGAIVDGVMAKHREAMHARMAKLAEARAQVRTTLQAEPFDRAALEDAFGQLRDTDRETAQEAHALLSDLAERATPEERQRLARFFESRAGRDRHSRSR